MNDIVLHLVGLRSRLHALPLSSWPSRSADEAILASAEAQLIKLVRRIVELEVELKNATRPRG